MKRLIISVVTASIALTACGSNEDEKLTQDIKALEKEKAATQKKYDTLKKENQKKDKEIKAKEKELAQIKKDKEEALKKQIAEEEKQKEEAAKKQAELKKKEAEKVKANSAVKSLMPNTIEASTNGKAKLVMKQDDVPLVLEDSGMKVEVGQLQIFSVTNMPEGQVLLFDGATDGFVIMYQVTTENTSDQTLYYNNNTKFTAGDHTKFSDFASFIPSDYQEMSMKKSQTNFNEYMPHEKTTSYKSIAISSTDYEMLKKGRATLVIQGGISTDKTFNNKTEKTSDTYSFK
ncbi:DUF5068 domain-containing protein [Macrococcus lamae]|uniref:DUF5068 domain-containing protein n=1 Tax=Macrococcus lamae TaxID=198484 RepID=A0A4R6BVC8_9STAP|nr:DUF5068 domain-containing protein [Macrococcus lamae]TDM12231.1 DUF5068 domain-containing protein [Macrococcus lamae]